MACRAVELSRPVALHPLQARTKIIATVGPACGSAEMVERLVVEAGVRVFRLNFSHGTHAKHAEFVDAIRTVEKRLRCPLAVIADLQGPKLRIGTVRKMPAVVLRQGQRFCLDLNDGRDGTELRVSFSHKSALNALRTGSVVCIDDGRIRLEVGVGVGLRVRVRVCFVSVYVCVFTHPRACACPHGQTVTCDVCLTCGLCIVLATHSNPGHISV